MIQVIGERSVIGFWPISRHEENSLYVGVSEILEFDVRIKTTSFGWEYLCISSWILLVAWHSAESFGMLFRYAALGGICRENLSPNAVNLIYSDECDLWRQWDRRRRSDLHRRSDVQRRSGCARVPFCGCCHRRCRHQLCENQDSVPRFRIKMCAPLRWPVTRAK